jgi:hypothetical protein
MLLIAKDPEENVTQVGFIGMKVSGIYIPWLEIVCGINSRVLQCLDIYSQFLEAPLSGLLTIEWSLLYVSFIH